MAAQPITRPDYAAPADADTIERTAEALRAKGYAVEIADDRDAARALVLGIVPKGAEVSQGGSRTLEDLGLTDELEHSGRYDAVRPKTRSIDRSDPEQLRWARKVGATPDWWVTSANALTEDGTLVLSSASGSQLGPISFGAGKVVFVIGAQKIVPDLDAAMDRIRTHVFPLEDARATQVYGVGSRIAKTLIVDRETRPGRFTVILLREAIGF